MDIKSIVKTDRLYWLGRYLERVYTTLLLFEKSFDKMIERAAEYEKFCESFEIPNVYSDAEDFLYRYPFDENNPDSLRTNLRRAYDNAIELREEIGSEALAYVQLTVYAMSRAAESPAPMGEFQKITDNILAFWGCIDDLIEDENTRNLLKVGKRVERIDLYGRLHMPKPDLVREIHRLSGRIPRCSIHYRPEVIVRLNELADAAEPDYPTIVYEVDRILG
ncbi:MAG: alpha-E domain-containing protein [Lachnospiraceae bacterium]|nr:alpha-E domain-containing protein [Lachnospiraceae bacterium]